MFPIENISNFAENFEVIKELAPNGTEIWRASNFMKLLGYNDWWRFSKVIDKSMINFSGIVENLANQNGVNLEKFGSSAPRSQSEYFDSNNHYLLTTRQFISGRNRPQETIDYYLTRLACYAIAMEADNRKPEVVLAKQYLLVLANKGVEDYLQYVNDTQRIGMRETLTNYENSLEHTYANHGVKSSQFGYVKSEADKGFYNNPGGTKAVKEELGIPVNKNLYDYMPVETMINKAMANYNTKYGIINKGITGAEGCAAEAYENNKSQREHMFNMQGQYPEDTMPAENITTTKKGVKKVNKNVVREAISSQLPEVTDPRVYNLIFEYYGNRYTLGQWCYMNNIDPLYTLSLIDSGIPFDQAIFMRPNNATCPILFT